MWETQELKANERCTNGRSRALATGGRGRRLGDVVTAVKAEVNTDVSHKSERHLFETCVSTLVLWCPRALRSASRPLPVRGHVAGALSAHVACHRDCLRAFRDLPEGFQA